MHEPRTLFALTLVAAFSWAVVIVDMVSDRSPDAPPERLILPELREPGIRIRGLAWHRDTGSDTRMSRTEDGDFQIPGIDRSRLDQRAVSHVVDSLETATYARDMAASPPGDGHGLDAPRSSLRVILDDGRVLVLFFGDHQPDIDRVFVARAQLADAGLNTPDRALVERADRVYLIDGHVARSLDVTTDQLRTRRVVPVPWDTITAVEIRRERDRDPDAASPHRIVISGRPPGLQVIRDDPGTQLVSAHLESVYDARMTVDPRRWRALAQALAEMGMDRFVDLEEAPTRAANSPRMRLDIVASAPDGDAAQRFFVKELGPCPLPDGHALRLVETSIGHGCMAPVHLAGFADALADPMALLAPTVLVDRPARLSIHTPRGQTVTIRAVGRSYTWDRDAEIESEAVDQWLDTLAHSSSGRYLDLAQIDRATMRTTLTLDATYRDGTNQRVRIVDHPRSGRLAQRDDEPVYLILDREPWASELLPADATRFQRRQLLTLEPYSLRRVERWRRGHLDAHLVRGELLEDWHAQTPNHGSPTAESVAGLRELAQLRAHELIRAEPAPGDGLQPPRLRLRLTFDPRPGEDRAPAHELEIGARSDHGCVARLDGQGPVFSLPRTVCETAESEWVQ